jgi:hypothetical protein
VEELALEDDTDLDENQAKAEPNFLDLKLPRGKRIYGGYKAYKALTEALGRELSVDDARAHMEAYSDKLAMEHEFSAGDPQAAQNWVHFWNSSDPKGMTTVGGQLPDYLATRNPDAYTAMALPVLNRYINAQYARAAGMADSPERKAILYAARVADWVLNDTYRQDEALPQTPSPVDQRAALVDQRWNQIQSYEQQQAAQRTSEWNQSLATAETSVVRSEAEKYLAPLKSALPGRAFNAAVNDFQEAVKAHLAKDAEGSRIYQINRLKGQQRQSSEDQQMLASAFAGRASRAARSIAPGFLKEYGVVAKANSAARHASLQQAAVAGAAPTSSGQPRQQSILPPQQGQFSSRTEAMESSIDSLLGATGRR